MKGFDRKDSSKLGFAVSCLFYGAISLDEFHQWVAGELERCIGTSVLLVDLIEFQGPLSKIFGVIGFTPDWPFPPPAKGALAAIAYRRGTTPIDCPVTAVEAEAKSKQYPQIEARFREMFPFVMF